MAKSIWYVPLVLPWLLLASGVSALQHDKLSRSADESSEAIAGSYIVVMKKGSGGIESLPSFDESYIKFRYEAVLNGGFAVENVPDDVMMSWMDSPSVLAVVEDSTVARESMQPSRATSVKTKTSTSTDKERQQPTIYTQENAPWNLDRIDHRGIDVDGKDLDGQYNTLYRGEGVTIAIVDDGIRKTHNEFQSRYVGCFDFTRDGCENPGTHGTSVASVAAGYTYGVAKRAKVLDVKVFESTPTSVSSWSTVIAGFDFVAQMKKLDPDGKYVLNASFEGGFNQAINNATKEVAALGVLVIVPAGNENFNACQRSPAAEPTAITVASTDIDDARSTFSNFGPCIDLFAPGTNITVASSSADDAMEFRSGTDMAAPHVAGVAALILERGVSNPRGVLLGSTTPAVVSNAGTGSQNSLLFNSFLVAPTNPPSPVTCPDDTFLFELLTDEFPFETSWILTETCTGRGVTRRSPDFYTLKNTTYEEEVCITSGTAYTFKIMDVYGDGLIAPGKYEISLNGELIVAGGSGADNNYGLSQTTNFGPACPPTPSPTSSSTTLSPTTSAPTSEETGNCFGFNLGETISSFFQRGRAFFDD